MVKLKLKIINDYLYTFENKANEILTLNLEFLNNMLKIEIGDTFYLSENLLVDKGVYTFGPINNKYSKMVSTDLDICIVEKENAKFYFQRYYG